MSMQPGDLRVLVIEDEKDSELVISTALQYGGVQSWVANSGEDGLVLVKQIKPNLLLVDLALPGIDGWEFLKRIKADPETEHIPAVVVSAFLSPSVARKALESGFVACFPKPIDTHALVRQLVGLFDS